MSLPKCHPIPTIKLTRLIQLECSSYLSFVPTDAPSHTMTSNRLYAASIDRVRNATAWSSGPGMDYSFLPAKYPVPWDIPDLEEQVTTFLSMPKPQNSPGQTLWVFSFGMWDIWSLASEPRELSIPIVDAMVSQMLTEVERIYQSALNESSIAWSNPSQRLRGAALNKTASAGSPVPSTTEHFRILMPKLFDPSLTPGWQTGRPDLPAVHSKAEQMRNAAALTNHWNQQLNNFMFRWVRTVDQMPKVDGEVDPPATYAGRKKVLTGKEAMAAYVASLQESKAKPNPKVGLKLDGSERKRPVKLPQPVQPREVLEVAPEPKAEGIVVVIQEEEPETTPQPDPIQLLQRDGIMYELNEYLADLIVDRQFRNTGLTDGLGVGTKPTQDGFLEVRKPCTEDLPNGVANHAGDRESEQPAIRGRAPVPSNSALPPNASRLRICEAPQEHLFFTPFTVSPRAIRMIARRAADMVRRNETARAQMAKQYLVPVGQPPIKKPHGGGTPVGS